MPGESEVEVVFVILEVHGEAGYDGLLPVFIVCVVSQHQTASKLRYMRQNL